MKVRAIRKGYYNHVRVAVGTVFYIKNEKAFSEKWMVKVGKKAESKVAETEAPREAVGLSSKAMHQGRVDLNIGKQEDFSGDDEGSEDTFEEEIIESEEGESTESNEESTGNQKVI